ncbi:MAG: DUF2914 domain-containing protein [Gammaproteobacteria bacterium]|nr:DUF2914 domain-containing protein [Gammaproteobacteria bacterium]
MPFDIAPEAPADKPRDADSAPPTTSSTGNTPATAPVTPPPPTTDKTTQNNVRPLPEGESLTNRDTTEPDASLPATSENATENDVARLPGVPAENNVSAESNNTGSVKIAQTDPIPLPPAQSSPQTANQAGSATALRPGAQVAAIPAGVTAVGGSVARSVLTSRVQNLEPTDVLGPDISQRSSGFTRVFYFTELREFSDGKVLHRWEHNDQITDEVLLKVQKSWRWRTYSNKDLTPGLTGQWRVSTIDASGKVLDTEEFTFGLE